MQNSADIVFGYAQRLADSLCDWPDEGWRGSDLEWETMKKQAPLPPVGLSNTQIKLIKRATAFGTVAGRPQTDPVTVQWFRDKVRRLRRAAKPHGLAELVERCFDIGYRAASSRSGQAGG